MDQTVLYQAPSGQGAVLHLFDATGPIGSYPLQAPVILGRPCAATSCDIPVDLPLVSRRHGRILPENGAYIYEDLNSTNGTYINGRLYGREGPARVELADGDVISFKSGGQSAAPDAGRRIVCLFVQGDRPFQWRPIDLREDMAELCVGRAVMSGLEISDVAVSRRHASFFRAERGWSIIDHNSTNGVYLNGARLDAPRYLSPFDTVRMAGAYFVFLGDRLFFSSGHLTGASEEPKECVWGSSGIARPVRPLLKKPPAAPPQARDQLCINIYERNVVQRFKKIMLLQNISMTVNNGEMVLILGGSGAGKTTFLNAVMGYEKAEGKITYRDTDIYEEYEMMKFEIGFVPQQDLLRGNDTVYETLANAAEMKLPRRMSPKQREKKIGAVLDELGLTREKGSLVSKLSGGQRKRLSIAVEFIADPNLFFLDEPDSGLDDVMGRSLMENLRHIADKEKIVMVITHSPERATDLFDKVIVLAKSELDNIGHLAFYGSVEQAFDFFGVSSFHGIVKKINRVDENGEGLADHFIKKYEEYAREV